MKFSDTKCCAIQEIVGLKAYKDGEEALKAFCRVVFIEDKGVKYKGIMSDHKDTIYSFYLFTAAIGGYDGGGYGQSFYDAIKKHSLGDVWQSPKVVNTAFHNSHSNQVYIWMPKRADMLKWWEKNKPQPKVGADAA